MSLGVKRATKIRSLFEDFVSSNVQEKLMVEEGMHSYRWLESEPSIFVASL